MSEIGLNCGIYQIKNIITSVCCVGQSMRLKQRPGEHWRNLKNNRHKNSYLQNSYNKRGREFFVFEILLYCKPEDLTRYEQLFCDIDKAHGLSYNIRKCVDSNKGLHHSIETCKKISEAQKGKNGHNFGKHLSEETCRKISEATKGEKNHMYGKTGKDSPNYGRKNSPETIEKMSEAQKGENNPMYGKKGEDNPRFGMCHTEEALEKMSESKKGEKNYMYGKKHSAETLEKMSEAKKGKNHPIFGKYHSEESIKIMSEVKKGKSNPMFGKTHSEETRNEMSKAKKGINHPKIIKKEIVLYILKLLNKGLSVVKILKQLDISESTVYKVKNGFYNDIYDLKTLK